MKDSCESDLQVLIEGLGISLEDIKASIDVALVPLKELTGYGKPLKGLIGALKKAQGEAQLLRSESRPKSYAYFGQDLEGRQVNAEHTLELLIEFLLGVDYRQQNVFANNYKRNRSAYSVGKKKGWMERFIAAIAVDICTKNISQKRRGETKKHIGAKIFQALGYALDGNIDRSFKSLLDRAKKDMKKDPLGLKNMFINKMRHDLNRKMRSKSCLDLGV